MHRDAPEPETGTLYVVATPIGNLADIGARALEVLRQVDGIAAEDTRTSQKLLNHYGIRARLTALHEHNERGQAEKLVERLRGGESLALISDAGTPAISDPGALLVRAVRDAGIRVVPVPGPCAAIAALSASGMTAPHFLFYGFLPAKAGARRREIEVLRELPHTLVFYEAPHRVLECVADLAAVLGGARRLLIARELTKTFETLHDSTLGEAGAWLAADANRQRGEFVLLVEGAPPGDETALDGEAERVLRLLLAELPLPQAARLAAAISGARKNALYARALAIQGEGV